MSEARSAAEAQLQPLMGIRAVAAVSVLLVHLGGFTFSSAVPLFFVLSGFILTYKYVRADQGLTVSVRAFWVARFSRLYPAHLLALLLLVVQHLMWNYGFLDHMGALMASLLMVNGWNPRLALAWNMPSWTNTCEMFFYLAFPLLVPLALRLRTRPALLIGMALAWGGGLALTAAIDAVRPPTPFAVEWWLWAVKFNPIVHLPEFVIGILLGRWYSGWGGRTDPLRGTVLSGAAFTLATAVSLYPDMLESAGYLYVHNTLLAPVFALGVWGLTLGGLFADILATPLLVRLGYGSYAAYILQDPLFTAVRMGLGEHCFEMHPALMPVMVVATMLVGVLVFHVVEEPAMRALRKRLAGSAPSAPRTMRVACGESLAALAMLALAVIWVSLLPERRSSLEGSRIEGALASLGAPRVAWVEGGDVRFLVHYDERVLGTRFERYAPGCDAPLVLAPPAWRHAAWPRFIAAEDNDRLRLWCRVGVPLPPRYRVTARTRFGCRRLALVSERGFHAQEALRGGEPFRWTDGHAVLDVPAPDAYVGRHLELRLVASAPRFLEVRADGQVIWSGLTDGRDQLLYLALPVVADGEARRIELKTPTWVPHEVDPASPDTRRLGVPVSGMRLMP